MMRISKISLAFALVLFLIFACGQVQQNQSRTSSVFPAQLGSINDFDSLFTDTQTLKLNQLIVESERDIPLEIVVVSLTSIHNYPNLFEYSLQLARHWKVGSSTKNNGILIAIYKDQRKIRIQTTDGFVRNTLTNEEAGLIMENTIIPAIKKGKLYNGLLDGIKEMMQEFNSEKK